ncbi:MAG: Trk system potassium transporter TrkA [Oscillospiraceae bacterium]
MNILIVGCGKAGKIIAQTLCNEGHEVTVMDSNPEIVRSIVDDNNDIQGIVGSALIVEDLKEAGVQEANIIIAITDSDEINIMCSLMARKCGAKHSVARVRNPIYAKQMVFMRDELGISMMINPEFQTANEIARMLRYPNALQVETFAKGRMDLAEIKVSSGGILDELKLSNMTSKLGVRMLVCAVKRDEEILIPDGNFVLHGNDKIYMTAVHSELAKFYKKVGEVKSQMKNCIIVGGGKIGYYLVKQLLEQGLKVKIIEQDMARCEQLSEWFNKADVIHADGTNQDILSEEGIATTDACIILTGIDEENIILSMYAKKIGVRKVITKINRSSLMSMSESMGLENIISPKETTAELILQYVRAKQNSQNSNIITLYRLAEGKLEAIEFIVRSGAKYVGIPLKNLHVNAGFLIAGIIRNSKRIIPSGEDILKVNDSVVVVTTNRKITSLDEMFQE